MRLEQDLLESPMLPHKLARAVEKLHSEMFHPVRMKIVDYDSPDKYEDWLSQQEMKCGTDFAYLFVLKLRTNNGKTK